MQGASRRSLAELQDSLAGEFSVGADVSPQLLSVAGLLRRESGVRAALTDPGQPSDVRAGVARKLLERRLGQGALEVVLAAVSRPWSSARDLTEAVETLGFSAAFLRAERDGSLDTVEDELFRFGRTLAGDLGLRDVLDNAQVSTERKIAILGTLLKERTQPTTLALLEYLARNERARFLNGIEGLSALAAERRDELVAEVSVVAPLDAEQQQLLSDHLARIYRRSRIRLQVSVDPAVIGGMIVKIGNDILDGSIAQRLDQARRRLAG